MTNICHAYALLITGLFLPHTFYYLLFCCTVWSIGFDVWT